MTFVRTIQPSSKGAARNGAVQTNYRAVPVHSTEGVVSSRTGPEKSRSNKRESVSRQKHKVSKSTFKGCPTDDLTEKKGGRTMSYVNLQRKRSDAYQKSYRHPQFLQPDPCSIEDRTLMGILYLTELTNTNEVRENPRVPITFVYDEVEAAKRCAFGQAVIGYGSIGHGVSEDDNGDPIPHPWLELYEWYQRDVTLDMVNWPKRTRNWVIKSGLARMLMDRGARVTVLTGKSAHYTNSVVLNP